MVTPHPPANAAPPVAPIAPGGWAIVVDDHPLFCDALALTLRSVAGFTDIRTADTLAGALELLSQAETPPALAVLDLNLPDVSGMDGLLRIRRAVPRTPVVVVSSLTENAVISSALQAGAAGYVPKHSAQGVFREALSAISGGGVFTPAGYVPAQRQSAERTDAARRLSTLTAQQARILELICEGKLNKQIAFDLSIAETTVKAHVTAIMRKLAVQSRTQAVLVAQEVRFSSMLPNENA